MLLSLAGQAKYRLLLQLLCITSCLLICCFFLKLPRMTPPPNIYVSHGIKPPSQRAWEPLCPPGYSSESFTSKLLEEQKKRLDHVMKICNKTRNRGRFRTTMARNILVDDYNKVLYCVIPKVACTTWKKYFSKISPLRIGNNLKNLNVHDWKSLRRAGYNYLHTYNRTEIHHRLDNYFKFMFVRDPFVRLLSAYREKFQLHNKYTRFFHRTFGQTIIARYRLNSSREERKVGNDVRFEEFIQYILELKDRDEEFNPHWDSFHELCHPCAINYNFIGQLETMQQDTQFIMQKISNSSTCQKIPMLFVRSSTTETVMKKYYSKISHAAIDELKELYNMDFQLFNYSKASL